MCQTSDIVLQHENSTLLLRYLKLEERTCYIIYAQRNDSVFKIISESPDMVYTQRNKSWRKYQLDLYENILIQYLDYL